MLVNEKEEEEERKKEDDEIGILRRLITRLPRTLRYVCECFYELLGSIILSACLVWGGSSFFGRFPAGASVWYFEISLAIPK